MVRHDIVRAFVAAQHRARTAPSSSRCLAGAAAGSPAGKRYCMCLYTMHNAAAPAHIRHKGNSIGHALPIQLMHTSCTAVWPAVALFVHPTG